MKALTTAVALAITLAPAAPVPLAKTRHTATDPRVEQLNQAQLDSLHAQNGTPIEPGFLGAPLLKRSPLAQTGQ